jgi:hypothetical protein
MRKGTEKRNWLSCGVRSGKCERCVLGLTSSLAVIVNLLLTLTHIAYLVDASVDVEA